MGFSKDSKPTTPEAFVSAANGKKEDLGPARNSFLLKLTDKHFDLLKRKAKSEKKSMQEVVREALIPHIE